MTVYRRVVSGFSTLRLVVDKLDRLLTKYQGRITTWVFDHTTAENTQIVVNFMNSVHAVNVVLQDIVDD